MVGWWVVAYHDELVEAGPGGHHELVEDLVIATGVGSHPAGLHEARTVHVALHRLHPGCCNDKLIHTIHHNRAKQHLKVQQNTREIRTRRERLKSALFFFRKMSHSAKNVKGGTFWDLLTHIQLQNIKNLEGGTLLRHFF